MDARTTKTATDVAKRNNRLLWGGVAAAGLLGYYIYKKREGDVHNVGDAASKTGAAVGRAMEGGGQNVGGKTGAVMKDEGKGFQGKQ